jgi:hypothetical protein
MKRIIFARIHHRFGSDADERSRCYFHVGHSQQRENAKRTITASYYPVYTSDNTYGAYITDETNGYPDYTGQTANVDPCSSYTFSYTVAAGDFPNYPPQLAVWIDWNQSYTLDDSGEEYLRSAVSIVGPTRFR